MWASTGGQMYTSHSEALPQWLWAESHKERGCKIKVRVDGAGAAAVQARGQVGTCAPVSMAPPSSTSGSIFRSGSSLPIPPRNQPITRKMWVQTPPMPPAWGCTASPWLTSHDRPRGHTGAEEVGDGPSQEARPQLGVGDSTGAARGATLDAWGQPQTPPAPPPPRKDPMTAAWAGAGVAFICAVFTGESERFLSSYTMVSSSESLLLACLPAVCSFCIVRAFTVSGS